MSDYEYRVIQSSPNGGASSGTFSDPKEAGAIFRSIRDNLKNDDSAELQRRRVNPWETVESTSPLRQPGD